MNGRFVGIFIVIAALFAGAGIYYTQTYAYYGDVQKMSAASVVVTSVRGELSNLPVSDFQSVDKDSSPLGYRACFTVANSLAMMTETYALIEAEPREATPWFDCFNADEIGTALENGTALAFLGTKNISDGFDRVLAVMDDGRGFAWHQLNEKYKD